MAIEFVSGKIYDVLQDPSPLREGSLRVDAISPGAQIIFQKSEFFAYDGYTRLTFQVTGSEKLVVVEFDHDNPPDWAEYFKLK